LRRDESDVYIVLGKDVLEEEKDRLRRGESDVYVVLGKDVLEEGGKMRVFTHKPKPPIMEALWTVESPLRDAVFRQRCSNEWK